MSPCSRARSIHWEISERRSPLRSSSSCASRSRASRERCTSSTGREYSQAAPHPLGRDALVFVLALGAALTYGAGDFLGGIATKRAGTSVGVVALSSVIGVVLLLALVWFVPADPTVEDVAWGAAG